jgi:hypothetical protein
VTLNRPGQEKTLWVFTCVVRIKKYGKVRLAVIYDQPERQGQPIYCFTRMLTWNTHKIVQVRCHHWDIEPLHERTQQFLGAEDSQLQTEAGVRRHLTLVFVVNSLLKSRDSESTHRGSANDRVPKRVAHVWSTLSPHPVGGVP